MYMFGRAKSAISKHFGQDQRSQRNKDIAESNRRAEERRAERQKAQVNEAIAYAEKSDHPAMQSALAKHEAGTISDVEFLKVVRGHRGMTEGDEGFVGGGRRRRRTKRTRKRRRRNKTKRRKRRSRGGGCGCLKS